MQWKTTGQPYKQLCSNICSFILIYVIFISKLRPDILYEPHYNSHIYMLFDRYNQSIVGKMSLDKYTLWLLHAKYSLSSSSPTQTTVLDTRTYICSFFPSFKIVLGRKGGEGLISIKGWLSIVLLQTFLVKNIYLKPWASILFYEPKRGLLINEKHLL